MITKALEAEVSELLSKFAARVMHEVVSRWYANGYHQEREMQTGIGPVAVKDMVYSFGALHHIPDVDQAIFGDRQSIDAGGEKSSFCSIINKLLHRNNVSSENRPQTAALPGIFCLLVGLGFSSEKLGRHIELYRSSKSRTHQEWLSRNTDGPEILIRRFIAKARLQRCSLDSIS